MRVTVAGRSGNPHREQSQRECDSNCVGDHVCCVREQIQGCRRGFRQTISIDIWTHSITSTTTRLRCRLTLRRSCSRSWSWLCSAVSRTVHRACASINQSSSPTRRASVVTRRLMVFDAMALWEDQHLSPRQTPPRSAHLQICCLAGYVGLPKGCREALLHTYMISSSIYLTAFPVIQKGQVA